MDNDRREINSQELNIFFKLIGQGIWYLQNVENALQTCLTIKVEIKEIGSVSEEEGYKLLRKHQKNTFGIKGN
jgi:hypothetical protein